MTKNSTTEPTKKRGEEWRQFPPYPHYLVSNLGRVWSTYYGKLISQYQNAGGYMTFTARKDGKTTTILTHRAVLWAFVSPPPSDIHHGSHLDGKPANNRLSNLVWTLPKDNARHKLAVGTDNAGQKNGSARIDNIMALRIDAMLRDGVAGKEIAETLNINPQIVYNLKGGRCWSWLTGRPDARRRQTPLGGS